MLILPITHIDSLAKFWSLISNKGQGQNVVRWNGCESVSSCDSVENKGKWDFDSIRDRKSRSGLGQIVCETEDAKFALQADIWYVLIRNSMQDDLM